MEALSHRNEKWICNRLGSIFRLQKCERLSAVFFRCKQDQRGACAYTRSLPWGRGRETRVVRSPYLVSDMYLPFLVHDYLLYLILTFVLTTSGHSLTSTPALLRLIPKLILSSQIPTPWSWTRIPIPIFRRPYSDLSSHYLLIPPVFFSTLPRYDPGWVVCAWNGSSGGRIEGRRTGTKSAKRRKGKT